MIFFFSSSFFFSRIRKYLPAKKQLGGSETPLATLWNEEKIRELEQEQTVSLSYFSCVNLT